MRHTKTRSEGQNGSWAHDPTVKRNEAVWLRTFSYTEFSRNDLFRLTGQMGTPARGWKAPARERRQLSLARVYQLVPPQIDSLEIGSHYGAEADLSFGSARFSIP